MVSHEFSAGVYAYVVSLNSVCA